MREDSLKFASESEFQKACNQELRDRHIKFYHKQKGRTYKEKAQSAGLPDLIIFFNSGLVLVELKQPGKTLSPSQVRWKEDLPESYPYYLCDTLPDFLKVIQKHT